MIASCVAGRRAASWTAWRICCAHGALLCFTACAVGPDYRRPPVQVPEIFREGVEWRRANANPQGAISSTWWLEYHDEELSHLIEAALIANQSIAAAAANYRLAQAMVAASVASLYPTVSAGFSGSRAEAAQGGTSTVISANVSASWEPDLWGQIRREIESSKANAQASDAELAGERLSIAASVATDYFELRQADIDTESLKQQLEIDTRLLAMTRAGLAVGTASNDDLLTAEDTLDQVVANLQTAQTDREQDEHAIAVLTGVPPGSFRIVPRQEYTFDALAVPLLLPSELLERRYDVVNAERTAAAANAKIGESEAAFFPTLDLSAEGGFQHNALANLFSLPNRFWSVGPSLAETLFDGGARTAAVREARATYDSDVANYRQAVLSAFLSVENSLSSCNHLKEEVQTYAGIFRRNQSLYDSERAQYTEGTASEQTLLTQQLILLQAAQNLKDTQASLTTSTVTLIENLGGGWQWNSSESAGIK
jgi:NodT family efflux transporter outer membrane factor (OMF) lipoprotein